MQPINFTNPVIYIIIALFMALPALGLHAKTPKGSEDNKDTMKKPVPPMDRNRPQVLETASFGLG